MQRTQIYLAPTQRQALQQKARQAGVTVSHLIRICIEQSIAPSHAHRTKSLRQDTLLQTLRAIAALGEQGPTDLATRSDAYLYGGT